MEQRLELLVIDDSLADARVLQALLKQARPDGANLSHALTADEGLERIANAEFDCVFLDYMLDGANGLDVLAKIRRAGNDVPIIAFSGAGNEQVAVEALKIGAQDYMVKGSLTPEAVERALSNAMEKVLLARQLAERRQELEDFAHVAAHDLRAPLTSVALLIEFLRDELEGSADPLVLDTFKRVLSGVDGMSRLLDSLLEYAEVGRSEQPLVPVDLQTVAERSVANLDKVARDANATITVGNLPPVKGDSVSLVQLFQNLIANAIKFRGDRPPVIEVAGKLEGDCCLVSIADNGIGVDPQHHQAIFAPFRRLHQKGAYEGSGIGLATCRRVVGQHKGQIWIESELGEGTTFFFTLPALAVDNEGGQHLCQVDDAQSRNREKQEGTLSI